MGTGGQISVLSDQYFTAEGNQAKDLSYMVLTCLRTSLCGGKSVCTAGKNSSGNLAKPDRRNLWQPQTLEKLAGDGKASCTGRENRKKLQIETTFDGTVHPEQTGSITNLSTDNFTPAAFVYGTLEGIEQGTLSDVSDDSERNRNANPA